MRPISIPSPKHGIAHPDRGIDCQFALEPSFQALAAEAQAAGWTKAEVGEALIELARAHAAGIAADAQTDADVFAAAGGMAS